MGIIQPVRQLVDIAPLNPAQVERIKNIATRAVEPHGDPQPGKEQCRYCKAKGQCPAQMAIVKTAPQLPAATNANVGLLPMSTISQFLAEWEDRGIENVIGAMKCRLLEACLAGHEDTFWGLGRGRGSRKWGPGAEERLSELCAELGKEPEALYTEPQLKSVAAVEKVLGKSKPVKEKLSGLIETVEGRAKLVRRK